jgi:hypothetical protein
MLVRDCFVKVNNVMVVVTEFAISTLRAQIRQRNSLVNKKYFEEDYILIIFSEICLGVK